METVAVKGLRDIRCIGISTHSSLVCLDVSY